jgi:hypothetical protein
MSEDDGSRIEAAEAGVHAEQRELDEHGAADQHVDAVDALPTPVVGPTDALDAPHVILDTSDSGQAIADHGHASHATHLTHDDDAASGHGADPNAGVLVALPPTPAWVMTAAGIAAVTIAVCVVLAIILADKVG